MIKDHDHSTENKCVKIANLLTNSERIYVTISYIPIEEPVRILGTHKTQNQNNDS